MISPPRFLRYLLCAALIQTSAAAPFPAPKSAPRLKGEQTLTVSSIPKTQRLEGGTAIGSAISISGDWLAVQQQSFLATPVIHLFQRQSKPLWNRKPWKWRAAIPSGYGDIHLHAGQLISTTPYGVALQVHALVDGEWSKIQELPSVGYYGLRFVGRDGKLALGDFSFSSYPRPIHALDHDPQSGTWSLQEVIAPEKGTRPWRVSDRRGDRIIATRPASGSAATIFEKGPAGWAPQASLPQPPGHDDGLPISISPYYEATFANDGSIVVLANHTDFLGNPTHNTLLRYQLGSGGEGWQPSEEREVDWQHARIAAIDDLFALYGGRTGGVGSPVIEKMALFDEEDRDLAAPKHKVAHLSWSGDHCVTSDCATDSLGNLAGTGVRIYRMIPPKAARTRR
jgi:hypothetical protein